MVVWIDCISVILAVRSVAVSANVCASALINFVGHGDTAVDIVVGL